MCVFHLSCSVHLDARPIHPMSVFSFVQQVARYEATYPPHARISISCNTLHEMWGMEF